MEERVARLEKKVDKLEDNQLYALEYVDNAVKMIVIGLLAVASVVQFFMLLKVL